MCIELACESTSAVPEVPESSEAVLHSSCLHGRLPTPAEPTAGMTNTALSPGTQISLHSPQGMRTLPQQLTHVRQPGSSVRPP